jgi:hypothetical protein
MGVLISLVAIPLRENVPNFSLNLTLQNPGILTGNSPRSNSAEDPCKRLQVVEISNT